MNTNNNVISICVYPDTDGGIAVASMASGEECNVPLYRHETYNDDLIVDAVNLYPKCGETVFDCPVER